MKDSFVIEGLEEGLEELRREYRRIDDDEGGIPAFIINAGYERAKPAFDSVELDGPYDERPVVERIKYAKGDWALSITSNDPRDTIAWFEYGTGIKGARTADPRASGDNYHYDVNAHGGKGWFYTGAGGTKVHTRGISGCFGILKARIAMEKAIERPSRQRKRKV